jgi:hypothetical protein
MFTVIGRLALFVVTDFVPSVMVGFCTPEAVVTFAVVPYAVAVPALFFAATLTVYVVAAESPVTVTGVPHWEAVLHTAVAPSDPSACTYFVVPPCSTLMAYVTELTLLPAAIVTVIDELDPEASVGAPGTAARVTKLPVAVTGLPAPFTEL